MKITFNTPELRKTKDILALREPFLSFHRLKGMEEKFASYQYEYEEGTLIERFTFFNSYQEVTFRMDQKEFQSFHDAMKKHFMVIGEGKIENVQDPKQYFQTYFNRQTPLQKDDILLSDNQTHHRIYITHTEDGYYHLFSSLSLGNNPYLTEETKEKYEKKDRELVELFQKEVKKQRIRQLFQSN